jgi:hypothetical protein
MLRQLSKRQQAIKLKKRFVVIDQEVPEDFALHVVLDNASTRTSPAFSDGRSAILVRSCTSRRHRRG